MFQESIHLENLPELTAPLFIAGFEGWGNALDVSRGMIDYMVRKLNAEAFGSVNPDVFYRFDEHRPVVDIQEGLIRKISPPGGTFYVVPGSVAGRDLILFRAIEPNLQWYRFVEAMISFCERARVKTIICVGSMYDNVLHTDMVVSALASSEALIQQLKERKVITVNYKGPGAIHSSIVAEAQKRGIECVSLWCHCPYYLQGTTHFGLLSHLGSLLSSWGSFHLDTEELERTWKELTRQIEGIISRNPELQGMISEIRKSKVRGAWDQGKKTDKVIHLEDFLKPK